MFVTARALWGGDATNASGMAIIFPDADKTAVNG